jgi:hypothetical protein
MRASAENVVAGWLGLELPAPKRQRRRPYYKTEIKRGPRSRRPAHAQLRLDFEGMENRGNFLKTG